MKFVVFISLLLTCTFSVSAAVRHAAAGMVLEVDLQQKTILLSCEGIPGYMPAGMAKFSVKEDPLLAGLAPGQLVDFAVLDEGTLRYAEGITIRQFNNLEQQSLAARRLTMVEELDASASEPKVLRIGERVPSAILMDQNRRQGLGPEFFLHPLHPSRILFPPIEQLGECAEALPEEDGTRSDTAQPQL